MGMRRISGRTSTRADHPSHQLPTFFMSHAMFRPRVFIV